MAAVSWEEFEPHLRAQLTHKIESQPEVLLEHVGGPLGFQAHLFLATLYGFDEQVDAEWRLPKVESHLFMPIPQPIRLDDIGDQRPLSPQLRRAVYELQSNYAWAHLDYLAHRHLLPADVTPFARTNVVTVVLVRYRRQA